MFIGMWQLFIIIGVNNQADFLFITTLNKYFQINIVGLAESSSLNYYTIAMKKHPFRP